MIDMHCHIIPGIDDGSRHIESTIKMVKRASDLGYDAIFATSHFIEDSHETKSNEINGSVKALNEVLLQNGIKMKIYVGNEVYFTPNIVELLQSGKICTLNNSRYVLIEFPMSGNIFNMEQVIYKMINSGYVPVIAHPERYEFVTKDMKKLLPLINEGALLQINVASIMGLYGSSAKKNVVKLLKNDMVHLIGTDAHDYKKVYDLYEKSMKKISKIVDEKKLNIILNENSNCILNNEYVYTWEPKLK